ncbi:hypothetical protein C2857_007266 [Epichloe festucae Fl1]|uniref:Cytochrome P450 n=1 Tax=Epichloe festucae (strain Fl1) TaxID=877507 RepID=A0A7S9KQL1_EPIFF|nr:hypothetical protein C2857_007266 [Epichloe festucae Fl1]
MLQKVLLVLGAAFAYAVFSFISGLQRNIAIAKTTNLPYVVVPCDQLARHWLVLGHAYARILQFLPKSWWDNWLDLMVPDSSYRLDFERFTRHGDVFLFVSSSSITVQVANAEAIRQIITQREKFPKPCQIYSMLRQFGENVVTTEGAVWKAHRKATSATFNETNSALVFREIIVQTNGMIGTWVDSLGKRDEPLTTVSADITRLTINVISYVGFGLRLLWPGQSLAPGSDAAAAKYASLDAPKGHSLSFVDTLVQLLNNILMLMLLPRWLLRILPFRNTRIAAAAYQDYVKYMDEMLDERIEAVKRGSRAEEGMDLLGALAEGSFGSGQQDEIRDAKRPIKAPALTRDEILGNAFIMFVAGHETSANTIHFTLINLAANPAAQRRIQKDIDELVGDSDCSSWNYEGLMGPMATSAIGACMNETLRIIPPGPAIPKQVTTHSNQTLNIEGRECMLPKGSLIMMHALKAQEDPRHWPYEESSLRPGHDDLRDYKPERWFETQPGPRGQSRDNDKDDEEATDGRSESPKSESGSGGDDSEDKVDGGGRPSERNAPPFFRPRRGAYLPFSDGSRSCVGRRVAQVEIMTFLLVLFQRYSIELATDEWASEDEVQRLGRDARADLYRKAQASSRRTLGQAESVITLGLQGKTVPMRLVRRGEEKYVNWMA